jgi:type IX secretion system PorP/SprF family membrane protein
MSADYTYRVNLTEKIALSMGLKAAIYNYYIALRNVSLVKENDILFQENQENNFNPNIGAGFYLYTDRWYVGLAVPTLIENAFSSDNQSVSALSKLQRHYYFIAGYVFNLNRDWDFKPSVVDNVVDGAPSSFDLTAQFLYRQKIWLGTSYRVGDAVAFLFDVRVTNQIMIGYSYDISISKLSGYNKGSHEIMLSIDLDKLEGKRVKSPRYF